MISLSFGLGLQDENLEHTAEQDIPMSEDIVSVCCDEERKIHSEDEALGVPNGTETSCFPTNSCVENIICDCQLSPPYIQSPPCAQPVDELDNTKKIEARLEVEMPGETNLLCTLREYLKHNIYVCQLWKQSRGPRYSNFKPHMILLLDNHLPWKCIGPASQ